MARRQRVTASREYDDQGVAAYGRGDWAEAVRLFRLALDNNPADEVITHNLSRAQSKLSEAQQSTVAAGKIHSLVESYAQSVTPLSSSGGLDFDQSSSASRPSGGLDFMTAPAAPPAKPSAADCGSVDFGPTVVNACHVPSGLAKHIEDEIPHTPAGDFVRKGFQAIADHDWQVAFAWFEKAYAREPGNAGIARLVDLARYTEARERKALAGSPTMGARQKAPEEAAADAEMDRQMGESEARQAAGPAAVAGEATQANDSADSQMNALIDEGMNQDLARNLAAYDRSHAASLAAPATDAAPNWRAFFDALFEPARINLRPTSVAGVRD